MIFDSSDSTASAKAYIDVAAVASAGFDPRLSGCEERAPERAANCAHRLACVIRVVHIDRACRSAACILCTPATAPQIIGVNIMVAQRWWATCRTAIGQCVQALGDHLLWFKRGIKVKINFCHVT